MLMAAIAVLQAIAMIDLPQLTGPPVKLVFSSLQSQEQVAGSPKSDDYISDCTPFAIVPSIQPFLLML